jgi:hypothetical protein
MPKHRGEILLGLDGCSFQKSSKTICELLSLQTGRRYDAVLFKKRKKNHSHFFILILQQKKIKKIG